MLWADASSRSYRRYGAVGIKLEQQSIKDSPVRIFLELNHLRMSGRVARLSSSV